MCHQIQVTESGEQKVLILLEKEFKGRYKADLSWNRFSNSKQSTFSRWKARQAQEGALCLKVPRPPTFIGFCEELPVLENWAVCHQLLPNVGQGDFLELDSQTGSVIFCRL
jgi:hypothetical protein